MSALRQLISFLEAALWLRWRLAAVKARRLFGGRAAVAGGGPGYRLAPSQVPVAGVDYDVDELPPELVARLEESRSELLDHARRTAILRSRRRRARRRRGLSLVTAGLTMLAVLGAGATALMTGSTGVPAVDRWLGIYEAASGRQDVDRVRLKGGDIRPRISRAGPPIEIRPGKRSRRIVATSYVSRSGEICSTVTDADRHGETGNISCVAPAVLNARIQRDGGALSGLVSVPDARVLVGFVTATADRVSAQGPSGPLELRLSDKWSPDISPVGSLRTFVAVEPRRPPIVNPRDYVVRIRTRAGRSVQIRP
jgi:hypothetical protein